MYLDENSIEFEFQTNRNVYVDLRQKLNEWKYVVLILTKQQKRTRNTKRTPFLLATMTLNL